MRTLLLLALLVTCGSAQDAWTRFLDLRRSSKDNSRPWALVCNGIKNPDWWKEDPDLVPLSAGRDLLVEDVPGDQLREAWVAKGWKEGAHWVLIARDGTGRFFEGEGVPTGLEIKAVLRSAGYRGTIESMAGFLRDNPTHGLASSMQVLTSMRMARMRLAKAAAAGLAVAPIVDGNPKTGLPSVMPGRISNPQIADEILQELAPAVESFSSIPDWWRCTNWTYWGSNLLNFDAAASPRLRQALWTMREAVLSEWRRFPLTGEEPLGTIWWLLGRALNEPLEIPQLASLPGDDFPSMGLIGNVTMYQMMSKQWEEMLAFTSAVQGGPAQTLTPAQQTEREVRQAGLAFIRAIAHAGLGNRNLCLEQLRECRAAAGPNWERLGYFGQMRDAFPDFFNYESSEIQALKRGLPGALPATTPGFRLVLVGSPSWQAAWKGLGQSEILAEWAPEELTVTTATASDAGRLKDLGRSPSGWALFRGEDLLMAGADAPNPAALAEQMNQVAPSALAQIRSFILANPDQMDARRERLRVLETMPPRTAFLPEYLADLVATGRPFDAKVQLRLNTADLRYAAAKPLVARAEDILSRWPDSGAEWRLLASWWPHLRSSRRLIQAFEGTLVPMDRRGWASGLPQELYIAIFEEARAAGRPAQARDCLELAWAGFRWRTAVGELAVGQHVDPACRETVYKLLADTYVTLRLAANLKELEREMRQMRGHGAVVGVKASTG